MKVAVRWSPGPATILIGLAQPTEQDGPALGGQTGARLAQWAGMSPDEFLVSVDRITLSPAPVAPGTRPDRELLTAAAGILGWQLEPWERVVLIGHEVATAFERAWRAAGVAFPAAAMAERPFDLHEGMTLRGARKWIGYMPDPSALSRYWIDKDHQEQAGRFVRSICAAQYLPEAPYVTAADRVEQAWNFCVWVGSCALTILRAAQVIGAVQDLASNTKLENDLARRWLRTRTGLTVALANAPSREKMTFPGPITWALDMALDPTTEPAWLPNVERGPDGWVVREEQQCQHPTT